MMNTSERTSIAERIQVLNQFTTKLATSGYRAEEARRILISGLKGYEGRRARAQRGGRLLHIGASQGQATRNIKKLTSKAGWFKDKEDDNTPREEKTDTKLFAAKDKKATTANPNNKDLPITTILFVENTRGGKYAAMLREKEGELAQITGFRVKIVEQSGTSLKALLVRSNPWSGGKCGRFACLPCEAGAEDSKCFKRNILYESLCLECAKEGKEAVYVGESSHSAYERAQDHMGDYRDKAEDSNMNNHAQTQH